MPKRKRAAVKSEKTKSEKKAKTPKKLEQENKALLKENKQLKEQLEKSRVWWVLEHDGYDPIPNMVSFASEELAWHYFVKSIHKGLAKHFVFVNPPAHAWSEEEPYSRNYLTEFHTDEDEPKPICLCQECKQAAS
jgi:hypothetical protein